MKEANQIAALPAAVAVEDILLCVDVERGPALLMQRTETHILPAARRPANPVLLPQVLQQGHSASACLNILAHALFPPLNPVWNDSSAVPRQGWWASGFFIRAWARGLREPK